MSASMAITTAGCTITALIETERPPEPQRCASRTRSRRQRESLSLPMYLDTVCAGGEEFTRI